MNSTRYVAPQERFMQTAAVPSGQLCVVSNHQCLHPSLLAFVALRACPVAAHITHHAHMVQTCRATACSLISNVRSICVWWHTRWVHRIHATHTSPRTSHASSQCTRHYTPIQSQVVSYQHDTTPLSAAPAAASWQCWAPCAHSPPRSGAASLSRCGGPLTVSG
jgi:hypothetical protein